MDMYSILNDYREVKECTYKGEQYSVRDNGAVLRHAREGKRIRKDDDTWTFGKPNENTGYMEIGSERVHRIVAFAFLGEPPTPQHIVDHIDTNRRNNRPQNLRWLTKLENALNNPITRKKIEYLCGSIEAFVNDPSIIQEFVNDNPNYEWMRTVTPEEAKASYERLCTWERKKDYEKSSEGILLGYANLFAWRWELMIQSDYLCENQHSLHCQFVYERLVISTHADDGIKKFSIITITFEDGKYVHEGTTFFEEQGAQKALTLAQGLEWEGEDGIDDYC